ncbi:TPA: hypothetical protein OHP68_004806 [Escherichia coli]|nr:hypothetical protein [Escherichia coli]
MLVRGAEPMEKRQRRILFSFILDLSAIHLVILDLSAIHLVILEQVTPAAASRQERSDRVSEEASFHRLQHFALTPHS